MENKDYIESNKLLGTFLGGEIYEAYEINNKKYYAWKGNIVKDYRKLIGIPEASKILVEQLDFHKNYKTLMMVYRKLMSISKDYFTDDIDNMAMWSAAYHRLRNIPFALEFHEIYDEVIHIVKNNFKNNGTN